MTKIVISGTGVYTPPNTITNDELVDSYNDYCNKFNAANADAIDRGEMTAKQHSSTAFIEKASGVKQRYMMNKSGATNPDVMATELSDLAGSDLSDPSVSSQMAVAAAKKAMDKAGVTPDEIDLLIFSSSIWERFVPSIAVEIQRDLGTKGYAFDMAMGCSSATFGMSTAMDSMLSGMANKALVITCEYITPAMNYTDRDSHFIFGDACVAMVLEREAESKAPVQFRIKTRELFTELSYNIAAMFGSRVLMEPHKIMDEDQRFMQNGRTVFKELLPLVIGMVQKHLDSNNYSVADMRRMWLHQANVNMNTFAVKKLTGTDQDQDTAPIILDEYANTAGAGCMIAFDKYHQDFKEGELGLICSFGASYSIGCMIVERV
ncbi:beta-ketoacyl-ACP synthase III [Temperatibacter marinus]|uniref:Beta-ketoacyl-ACP synthase III n=1 Tax=Temperatibacter marinus TaxID=1456591 RepID=A0AA52H9E4_9PROT|nr:beta-ketoacyl-ACP synthase III [Temperatibacter marinus]WND01553.1 beta-ketoacyl-ACP synthase III [Temperatibacter marinus]